MVWQRACPPDQFRHNSAMRPVQLPSKSFLIHRLPIILTQQPYSLGYWQRNEITNHDTPIGVPFTERGDTLYFYTQSTTAVNSASYPVSIEGSFPQNKLPGRKLTTHFYEVTRLKMRGPIPPGPLTLLPCRGA